MHEFLIGIYSGVISGIVASLIFYWVVSRLKPNITISPTICKSTFNGELIYGIKIINNSIFSVLDLKAELCIMTPFNSPGGQNYDMAFVKLRKSELAHCSRYSKSDTRAYYAIIFVTIEDLEALWSKDGQILRFKINCRHSFSGFSKSNEVHYYTKRTSIKDGMFNFGKSFVIS